MKLEDKVITILLCLFIMVQEKLDHWFRHEYGRVVSIFVAKYGAWQIDGIEDAIQNAMYKAMMVWGYKGIPEEPSAWLFRVAQNSFYDQLRKSKQQPDMVATEEERLDEHLIDVKDETLRLIFACCHPKLKEQESIILCLKFAAGFGLHEISRALFISYEAAKKKFQRARAHFKTSNLGLKRARAHFKTSNLGLEIPANDLLKERLDSVLKVIFLMFTEGYRPTEGEQILKEDLCFEALRVAMTIYKHENFNHIVCFSSQLTNIHLPASN